MQFIERRKDEPFFCYLPTYSPHGPLKVPEGYIEPYRMTEGGACELYDIIADPFQQHNLAAAKPEIRDKMIAHYEAWWEDVAPHLARGAERTP